MKSAAFNFAFKVHRDEIPFSEGLLKSLEAQAQRDFIEALNSLAGETRYDVNQLDRLIQEAQSASNSDTSYIDVNAIQEEIDQLKTKRSSYTESTESLQSQLGLLKTSVIPGINSGMLFIVGLVMSSILFIVNLQIIALVVIFGSVGGMVYLLAIDLDSLKKQQNSIDLKKKRILSDINVMEKRIDKINLKIREKSSEIQAYSNPG